MADKRMSRRSGFSGDTSMNPTVTNSDSKRLISTTTNNMRTVIAKTRLKATDHVKKAVATVPGKPFKEEAMRTLKGYDYKMKKALKDPACKPLKEDIKKAIQYLELSLKSIQNGGADESYIKNILLKQYTEQYYDPLFKRINQHKQRSARINKNKQQK